MEIFCAAVCVDVCLWVYVLKVRQTLAVGDRHIYV